MATRYWHWLLIQKNEIVPTEYKVRGTAINNSQFSPDYAGYERVPLMDNNYYSYYLNGTIDPDINPLDDKVYYYYDYQTYTQKYFYIENNEVVDYTPPKPNGSISFNVKFITNGVVDSESTQIDCDIDANGNWEFTYPNTKKIYSLDDFCNESNYSYSQYGVIEDGDAILQTVDFTGSDGLRQMVSMNNAFKGCYELQNINFGYKTFKSLTSATDAFYDANIIPSVISRVLESPNLTTDVGAYSFFKDGIHYSVFTKSNVDCLRCDGYNKNHSTTPIIPSSIVINNNLTLNVTEIGVTADSGRAAFLHASITTVTIPNTVTRIGVCAFRESGITTINIPNSVTSIGSSAFVNCYSLTTVTIPNSVTTIEEAMFWGCNNLTTVNLPNTLVRIGYSYTTEYNAAFSDIGEYYYGGYGDYLDGYNPKYSNDAWGVFNSCYDLNISIPNSVRYLGTNAFKDTAVVNVTIPNGVAELDGHNGNYPDGTFMSCSNLTTVRIPISVITIRSGAFSYNNNVTFYCAAASQPQGWENGWEGNGTVIWGATW